MAINAFDFIKNSNLDFRKKIDGCYVGFASILDEYKEHIAESNKEEIKSPSDFLKKDFILELMIKDFGCYQEALDLMREYAEN